MSLHRLVCLNTWFPAADGALGSGEHWGLAGGSLGYRLQGLHPIPLFLSDRCFLPCLYVNKHLLALRLPFFLSMKTTSSDHETQ